MKIQLPSSDLFGERRPMATGDVLFELSTAATKLSYPVEYCGRTP